MYLIGAIERELYRQHVMYFRLLDDGRFDDAALLFRDAVMHSPDGTWNGENGARELLSRIILHDGSPRTKHLIGTCDIKVAADEREAWTVLSVLVLQEIDGAIEVVRAVRYRDTFSIEHGGCRLVERVELPGRLDGDLSRHLVS